MAHSIKYVMVILLVFLVALIGIYLADTFYELLVMR
jgi:hypothetical protein